MDISNHHSIIYLYYFYQLYTIVYLVTFNINNYHFLITFYHHYIDTFNLKVFHHPLS